MALVVEKGWAGKEYRKNRLQLQSSEGFCLCKEGRGHYPLVENISKRRIECHSILLLYR